MPLFPPSQNEVVRYDLTFHDGDWNDLEDLSLKMLTHQQTLGKIIEFFQAIERFNRSGDVVATGLACAHCFTLEVHYVEI